MAEDDVLQKKKSHRDRHSGIWSYNILIPYVNLPVCLYGREMLVLHIEIWCSFLFLFSTIHNYICGREKDFCLYKLKLSDNGLMLKGIYLCKL
jgi:hypothetical protein